MEANNEQSAVEKRLSIAELEMKLRENVNYQSCIDELLETFGRMHVAARESKNSSKKMAVALKFKFDAAAAEQLEIRDPSNAVYKSVKQFGAPYFKDSQGFAPCKNEDEAKMEKLGFLDIACLNQPVKWQHWEMKLLDETVRKVALGVLRRPLVAKRATLLDQQKTQKNANMSTALVDLLISELNKKIFELSGEALFETLNSPGTEHDWSRISVTEFESQRSPLELQAMWRQCLVPTLLRKPWSKEETDHLREVACRNNFENWTVISAGLGGRRSMYQCFLHYQSVLNRFRDGWTDADDKKLKASVKALKHDKFVPWDKVAEQLPGKSVTQIVKRWTQHLDPRIKSGGFTERDDMILTAARSQKMTFRQITALLPGRTESQLRIRYTRLECFKPSVPWIPEDDQKLLALVKQFKGSKDLWAIICEYFPERDRQQLKGRYKRLQNDCAGVKNTLPRKGKKSIWTLNKRRTTPIFNARNVIKFASNAQNAGKVGRKGRKKDALDLEFDQVFRSHYAQPKGRKRKYHPNSADPESVVEGRRLAEMFGVHLNWGREHNLVKAASSDPDFHGVLNVYRQLKMMHREEGWNPASNQVAQLTPPNICTLIGLRTLLLEERNILAMTLQGQTEVPTYLKGIVERADLNWEDVGNNDGGVHLNNDTLPPSSDQHISPALAISLFKQRFFSLFIWPSLMSQLAPSLDYKKELFEGERMACASSDEEGEAVENLFLDFDTDEEAKKLEESSEEDQKKQLMERWLEYREQKINQPDEERNEVPSVLQKKRRLPKKRGRKKLDVDDWLQSHIRNNLDSW
ncbi:Hypothetical predicted protein [Cloeon dipterum]|uniref:snRNA-activating protein complex subunit 4 n=1 Tax=Cloeon dipterum TaxID=197152 RepID=A0A8S1CSK6_9INSE|nr:Hypothetical predicted protein [Cloeon dipterum]